MTPRDLIVKGLLDSGFIQICRYDTGDVRDNPRSCAYLFQHPGEHPFSSPGYALTYYFNADGTFKHSRHHVPSEGCQNTNYLLPLEIEKQPSRFLVADLIVSLCGTACSAHVYDKAYETYWHVERVVGHPHRATEIVDQREYREDDYDKVTYAEDLVCDDLRYAVTEHHKNEERLELEAWRDQLNED